MRPAIPSPSARPSFSAATKVPDAPAPTSQSSSAPPQTSESTGLASRQAFIKFTTGMRLIDRKYAPHRQAFPERFHPELLLAQQQQQQPACGASTDAARLGTFRAAESTFSAAGSAAAAAACGVPVRYATSQARRAEESAFACSAAKAKTCFRGAEAEANCAAASARYDFFCYVVEMRAQGTCDSGRGGMWRGWVRVRWADWPWVIESYCTSRDHDMHSCRALCGAAVFVCNDYSRLFRFQNLCLPTRAILKPSQSCKTDLPPCQAE